MIITERGINPNDAIKYVYNGKKIIVTNHETDRDFERWDLSIEQKEFIYRNAIDVLKDKKSGDYLIFSKSLHYGMIVNYRPDKFSGSRENHLILITVLPKDKKTPKPGTSLIMVECFGSNELFENGTKYSTYFASFITDVCNIHGLNLNESEEVDIRKVNLEGYNFQVIYIGKKLFNIHSDVLEFLEIQ